MTLSNFEFMNVDLGFNVLACAPEGGYNSLLGWLTET